MFVENIGNGVVLITSGPTSVPIDPVRSIENFSTGVRGARLAENFLKENWNVIFLYRNNSGTIKIVHWVQLRG
jgi:phosphopantothenate-cysteine ligase